MSTSEIRNVMVVGASGNTGRPITEKLLQSGFSVSALTRTTSTSTFPAEVNVVKSDYTTDDLARAFRGQDAVVSTIATFSTQEQISIIDAMIAAGVKRFVPSEFGVDTSDPRVVELLPPTKGKVDTIAYLKTKQDKLSWTGLIVGGYFDWAMLVGGLGWNLRNQTVTVYDSGDQLWEATNINRIAQSVAACLQTEHYEETKNRYVFINSFTVSQNQVIAELEKAMGAKLTIERVQSSEMAASARQELATGEVEYSTGSAYVKGSIGLIACQIYNMDGFNNFSQTRGLWNDRLGLPKESLEETVREVVAQLS
jgi:hypothetical protein